MKQIFVACAFALSGLLTHVTPAAAGDTECVGFFFGVADNIIVPSGELCILEGAQVHGNVLAEPESELFIGSGTNIAGNVEVKQAAATAAFQSTIGGNYKCDNCFFEDVIETGVGGNVDIVGADDGDFIIGSTIAGNVHISESTAGAFAFVIFDTSVLGNVIFQKNSGPTDISENIIGGELQIFDNNVSGQLCPGEPEPCLENGTFSGNDVGGNMQVYKNEGATTINDNIIRENLQCFDNVPAPASAGNLAQKHEGQCRA
jgi:hypothetical protein